MGPQTHTTARFTKRASLGKTASCTENGKRAWKMAQSGCERRQDPVCFSREGPSDRASLSTPHILVSLDPTKSTWGAVWTMNKHQQTLEH